MYWGTGINAWNTVGYNTTKQLDKLSIWKNIWKGSTLENVPDVFGKVRRGCPSSGESGKCPLEDIVWRIETKA